MLKPVSFSAWKKLIHSSYNDFNRWSIEFYKAAYLDGIEYAENKSTNEINYIDLSDDELMNILLSISGIGEKRAKQIVAKILGGTLNGNET